MKPHEPLGELVLESVTTAPREVLGSLLELSQEEGFRHIDRFLDDWESGVNCFAQPGEIFLFAKLEGCVVAAGGLNRTPRPDFPHCGRIRRFYVRPELRRHGVGRAFVAALLEHARSHFETVVLRAPETAFAFYEAVGFRRTTLAEDVTHVTELRVD